MRARKKILIVGGYGEVGRRISVNLATDYAGRLIIAGRDARKAARLADELGQGAGSLGLDANDPAALVEALDGVGLAINCIDAHEPHLARAVVARGLAYLDITAHVPFWRAALALNSEARRGGARILLGAGLIPGIANVMARAAAERVGEVEYLNTALHLSLGDRFGPAALDYMLSTASEPFFTVEDGRERKVRNFTDGRTVDFPSPFGRRTVFRFALPEQVFYPRTLHIRGAATRLALDPPWVTSFLAMLAQISVISLLKQASTRRAVTRLFAGLQSLYRGHETYALMVEAQGARDAARLGLVGENESDGTALGAAIMARAMYEGRISQPGVWLPEQVIAPAPFFEKLTARGLLVQEYA